MSWLFLFSPSQSPALGKAWLFISFCIASICDFALHERCLGDGPPNRSVDIERPELPT
jgi:hypothetical protein